MDEVSTFDVIGARVHALTPKRALAAVLDAVETKEQKTFVFCTVSTLLSAHDDPAERAALEDADYVTPDGMPLVWIGRKQGRKVERVYGPDFMLEVIGSTQDRLRHFFYGGAPGVAEEMATRLERRFPSLVVAGCATPPMGFDPHSPLPNDIEKINSSGADVLWVGLGHPKQDIFMMANREVLNPPVICAVGAAFDFHAGRKREAPGWMKRSGLQWLHRLLSEPRRLWRRYLIGNSRFVWLYLRSRR